MAEWVAVLSAAQKILDAGNAKSANEMQRAALARYADDPNATQWITFNLMQSEIVLHGPKAVHTFLPVLIRSSVTWAAKLYALELALAAAEPGDANLGELYGWACELVGAYAKADTTEDANIMSCQSFTRRMQALYPANSIDPLFAFYNDEDEYPVVYAKAEASSPPGEILLFNRIPRVLQLYKDHFTPPKRPLGFRKVGKGYVVRLGDNTIVYNAHGQPLCTPYGPIPNFLKAHLCSLFKTFRTGRRIDAPALFIGDYFSQSPNYCHWTLDALPRIEAARQSGLNFTHVVGVFDKAVPFVSQTLDMMLEKGQTYIGVSVSDGLTAFEQLYYADNAGIDHLQHPAYGGDSDLLTGLRQSMRFRTPTAAKKRRLYVPRRQTRVVTNHLELVTLLQQHGFDVIDTDALSVQEQADVFASASAIIAPHGAALTNLLFTPHETHVLELFPAFGGSASFYLLSSALGHRYSCYIDDVSQGAHRDDTDHIQHNTSAIWVDIPFVTEWLKTLPDV